VREPTRFPRVVDEPAQEPAEDLRPWSTRNAKSAGTIIGTALATLLVGTGGLTGLAHVAGIATVKEIAALDEKLTAAERTRATAADVDSKRFTAITAKLDALAKDTKALRADAAKKVKKPKANPEGQGE